MTQKVERTKVKISIEGVDITKNISNSLSSLSYVDNDTDKADDLQLAIDDKEGKWLHSWLNQKAKAPKKTVEAKKEPLKVGDKVKVSGRPQYTAYGGRSGGAVKDHIGKVTRIYKKSGATHPIHVDYLGWFKESQVSGHGSAKETATEPENKGLEIAAIIIQENHGETGHSKVLDCGVFCVDTINVDGPPTTIKLKALSIPRNASIKEQEKDKAWENTNLKTIAGEIAKNAGMKLFYDSNYDPKYKRREQKKETDLKFLKRLCTDAGINIKVTAKTLVLYNSSKYESNKAIKDIKYGVSNIIRYAFNTNKNSTAYTGAVVKSKNPTTGKYIEYKYNLPKQVGEKKILEIKEKVNSKEEAKQLAINRLRKENTGEYNASITVTGDVDYVAGQNVNIVGFGMFDGKYFINSATHKITGGYTTALKLSKVLEGY